MTTRSLHTRISVSGILIPQAYTTTAIDGADVDISAAESAEFVFVVGTQSGTTSQLVCQEADDDGAGSPDTYTDVAAANLVGGANDVEVAATTDDRIITRGYKGTKKWVRVRGEDKSSGNLILGGCVLVGHQRHL